VLDTGVGVGSAVAEFRAVYPDMTLGVVEECAGEYRPADFDIVADTGWLHGSIAWDWVADVQRALNERGATLVVDGEYGPSTREEVKEFQATAGINSTSLWDSEGEIGPLTLDALEIEPPPTSTIASLRAGGTGGC
jgi:peptidoglycan hydrolase-like protein with peptidoglycan-binding domain